MTEKRPKKPEPPKLNPGDRVGAALAMLRVHKKLGGRLLQDIYPTHYMPHVGRQVMQEGGDVEPIYDPMGNVATPGGLANPPAPHPREELEKTISPEVAEKLSVAGLMLPNRAAELRETDTGLMPFDREGKQIPWMTRPGVLPLTKDEGEVRWAMPYVLEMAGNVLGSVVEPVRGAGTILGSGPIRRAATEVASNIPDDIWGAMAKSSSVAPEGNVRMRPSVSQYELKGPETQTVESFINQVKGMPGISPEVAEEIALRYHSTAPGTDALKTPITKAEFEKLFEPSKYNKVDLKEAAKDPDAHLWEEARSMARDEPDMVAEDMLLNLGVKWHGELDEDAKAVVRVLDGEMDVDELPEHVLEAFRKRQIDDAASIQNHFDDAEVSHAERIFEQLRENADDFRVSNSGYEYESYQRLVPKPDSENYFELGVTHPAHKGDYSHYEAYSGKEPLVGHIRGQFFPNGGEIFMGADQTASGTAIPAKHLKTEPKSMVIEELQSDVQKGVEQAGHTMNIHATLFKTAIQHALENGATTVYYPKANMIAWARNRSPSQFRSIYDQEVVKQGLNPLLKIPGVTSEKIGDKYIKLQFSPEAVKYILKGPGQRMTNYAYGGEVTLPDDFFADWQNYRA